MTRRKRIHACAMVINNKGWLITGESGSGKSETCLALLERQHLFIADDAVDIAADQQQITMHAIPELFQKIQVYELGLIDLSNKFPASQFCQQHRLDYILRLLPERQNNPENNLLNGRWSTEQLMGIKIPMLTLSQCRHRHIAMLLSYALG